MASFFPRGVAVTAYKVQLTNSDGTPHTTGTPTVVITKDDGAQTPATNTPTHLGGGEWSLDLTASERDAKITSIQFSYASMITHLEKIVSDDQLGPGATEIQLQFGTVGKLAEIWITTQNDTSVVVASGTSNASGNVTFFLDPGSYYAYGQKVGVNFNNPIAFVVT